ncbi:hypothetical protein [Nostoc sp. UHCC 0870]|uniref:hypothetical protein n=1 Tax=Nostoc sp. UHCC 0870 TaxID=2914041 RepID=UPI001EDFEFDE|nr:hypothetical protein [Nostoc sp. UHCC 0870]
MFAVKFCICDRRYSKRLPTVPYQQGKRQGQIPDWGKITWEMLPAVQQAGYLTVPKAYQQRFGYDPSRSWNAGQKSDSVIMLGDADDEFRFADFTLDAIGKITSNENSTLKDVGFVKWQTTASLVKAIPSLGNLKVNRVKPILDVLGESGYLPSSCRSGTNCSMFALKSQSRATSVRRY